MAYGLEAGFRVLLRVWVVGFCWLLALGKAVRFAVSRVLEALGFEKLLRVSSQGLRAVMGLRRLGRTCMWL